MHALNQQDIAAYAKAHELAFDAYDFYNLRAALVIGGGGVITQVLDGKYAAMHASARWASPVRNLQHIVSSSLVAKHFMQTERILLDDVKTYDDNAFVRLLHCDVFKGSGPGAKAEQWATMFGDPSIEGLALENLGVIQHGLFLKHIKLGVCWVYRVLERNRMEVVFKDGKRLMYIEPTKWERLAQDGWS